MRENIKNEMKDFIEKNIPFYADIKSIAMDMNISVHLVGGSVRDLLLNRGIRENTHNNHHIENRDHIGNNIHTSSALPPPHYRQINDWDFVVSGDLFAFSRRLANQTDSYYVILDKINKITRVIPKDRSIYLDFAFCRGEIENDLKMRDYTINSLALDMNRGEIIDPTGGREDLKKGIIRVFDQRNILDDPLRILRAYRMKCFFNFKIEENTLLLIKKYKDNIRQSAIERVKDEIFKILKTHKSAEIMKELYYRDILTIFLPELHPMEGMSQNHFHKYDVLGHSFETLRYLDSLRMEEEGESQAFEGTFLDLAPQLKKYIFDTLPYQGLSLIKFVSMLHDIGKPGARRIENGILYYVGHEDLGSEMWIKIGKRFKLSRQEIKMGEKLIKNHLYPVFLPLIQDKEEQLKQMFRFFKSAGDSTPGVILLSWADVEAGQGEALKREMIDTHHEFSLYLLREYFNKSRIVSPPRYFKGEQIMNILKINSGKIVGELLSELEELSATGVINSLQDAHRWIRNLKPVYNTPKSKDKKTKRI